MKELIYNLIMFILIAVLVYFLTAGDNDKKYIDEQLKKETQKREEIVKQMELLKSEKKDLDLSIENLKKSLDKKEKGLLYSIQEIKNKGNVQVRNVIDSSFTSLLKELQPN